MIRVRSDPPSEGATVSSAPQTFLVTGATDGIGKALAMALARQGQRVILHGRHPQKLAAAVAEVQQLAEDADRVASLQADFASLSEVAAAAQQTRERFPELSVLVNNAGLLTDHRQLSADGYELTFAVNYLAPYLLTRLLIAGLKTQTPARVVNVASTAFGGGFIDPANLQLENGFRGWQAYANSKLANIMFSNTLSEQLAGSGVVSNALCPGLIDSNFFHTNTVFADGAYERMRPGMRTPEEGALVPLYLAADPAAADISGRFFVRVGRDGRRSVPLQRDRQLEDWLWEYTEQQVADWLV